VNADSIREVRVEYLAPHELDAAMAVCPIVYLPLGGLEFHGAHLPIGLDAITAHGLCVAAAGSRGGVVLPPLYQGVGGGHTRYPWTLMMARDDEIRVHLHQTLVRLESFGVRLVVLFSGHFADEQLAMIDEVAARWRLDTAHSMAVLATAVNRCESSPVAPDHAGEFETLLLVALHPDLVHLDRLPSCEAVPIDGLDTDPVGPQRHDPLHPLWGIFGPDPRMVDSARAAPLHDHLVAWLAESAARHLALASTTTDIREE
jgi:creatinine amidohydrolase